MDIQVQSFAVTNLRRRPVVIETGGFVAGFTPDTDNPYLNYATPLPGAEPTEQDVAALIGIFRERGLLPRLEFAPQAARRGTGPAEGRLRHRGGSRIPRLHPAHTDAPPVHRLSSCGEPDHG